MSNQLLICPLTEIPSSSVPQGTKHMTLPAFNKDMDPKGAAALLERRRVSASVSEIRDLYSALQELVPGNAAGSFSHRLLPEENILAGVSSGPSSPRLRRRIPNNSATEQSLARSPTGEDESSRVRRLLPVTPHSPSSLRKFNSKPIQTLDVNANQGTKKGKRAPNMERRGSSGEVLLSMQNAQAGEPSPNMGRRGSSGEVLLGVRANQIKTPKSPLAMVRSASNQDIYRAVQNQTKPKSPSSLKLDRLVSPNVLARRGSEGVLLTPNMEKHGKRPRPLKMGRRGSSGDILTTEGGKTMPIPPSPLASPQHDTIFNVNDSHPQGAVTDSSPRQNTLKNALTKFSHSFKKKTPPASPEPKQASAETNVPLNQLDSVDGSPHPKKLHRLQSQMDLLLNSLDDLQGSSKEPLHASMSDPVKQLDQRRASLGTEMQKLLGALHELCPGSDSDSVGEHEPRSRGGSESHERVPVERESLDQLEAYFTEKLRDATRAEATSKTPSERSSESEAPHSDKEDGEVNETSALSSKKTSLEEGSVDEGIDLIDHPAEVGPNGSSLKRPPSKEDRDQFANQVNKKLQDWLEKAMTLAQQEKENLKANENFTTCESEEFKFDSFDSDEGDGNRDKEPKRLKRNLFNKLSFLRRGDKSKGKHGHRRSRSMHDITISLESERQFQDGATVEQSETATEQAEIMSRRPSTVIRSRSLYNVGHTRNKNRRKEMKEAEDVLAAEKDVATTETAVEPAHVVTQRSTIVNSSSQDFANSANFGETPARAERPKVSTSPTKQQLGNKNLKPSTSKKRLRRLLTDLPFFYTPEAEKSAKGQETSEQTQTESPSRNRKKLFSPNGVIYTGLENSFYTEEANKDRKLRKTSSNTLPYPRILVNESSNYFFGDRIESEVTLFYPNASPLRRCASMDSFLNAKELQDCEETEPNVSSYYSNELSPDDVTDHHLLRRGSADQPWYPSPPAHAWEMEVTI